MNFYVVDENDPIMSAYNDIFPDLFSPKSEMSSELLDHIRYPEDLFTIQSDMYRDYHMTDPALLNFKLAVVPFTIFSLRSLLLASLLHSSLSV